MIPQKQVQNTTLKNAIDTETIKFFLSLKYQNKEGISPLFFCAVAHHSKIFTRRSTVCIPFWANSCPKLDASAQV